MPKTIENNAHFQASDLKNFACGAPPERAAHGSTFVLKSDAPSCKSTLFVFMMFLIELIKSLSSSLRHIAIVHGEEGIVPEPNLHPLIPA